MDHDTESHSSPRCVQVGPYVPAVIRVILETDKVLEGILADLEAAEQQGHDVDQTLIDRPP